MEQMLTWNYWVHSTAGSAHFVAASVAMTAGPLILLRRKGTGSHRALGRLYVIAMLAVNVSALSMYELTGGPNLFHFFAAVSLLTVVPGVICAVMARRTGMRGRLIEGHYFFMVWSYVGLIAAFVSQILTRAPFDAAALDLALPGGAVFWIAGGVGFLAFGVLSRLIDRTWRRRMKARYGQ